MRSKVSVSMAVALLLLMMCAGVALAQQASNQEMTALDKTAVVEKYFYGSEQSGALVDRVAKMEKDVYGLESKDTLLTKVDRMYSYVTDNASGTPSFATKLNATEWTLTHAVTADSVNTRLGNLERVMVGSNSEGSFDSRLAKLAKLAYANGYPYIQSTPVTSDILIKIKMVTALDTRTARAGDEVLFQAADDVTVGDALVIPKGALGIGKVTKVEHSKNFGRDAKLEVAFNSISAVDGSKITTILGDKAKEQTRSMAKAAGATVAGIAVLGPIGVVGGAFIQGEEVKMPAGSELYIQTKTGTEVYGLQIK